MKKKIILGVVAVIVVALVVAAVMLCRAPDVDLNMDGTYVALDGSTLTISGDTLTCSDETYSGTLKRVKFSADYISENLFSGASDFIYKRVDATLENEHGSFVVCLREEGNEELVKYVAIWNVEDKALENGQYFFTSLEIAESVMQNSD